MDLAAHTFVWKIDREATKAKTGLKHEECSVCGFKRSENTEIAKLPGGGSTGNTGSTGNGSSTAKDDAIKSPKTGDTSDLVLWVTLLLVSGTAIGATVVGRKKGYSR